jgi:hypothetical protein
MVIDRMSFTQQEKLPKRQNRAENLRVIVELGESIITEKCFHDPTRAA